MGVEALGKVNLQPPQPLPGQDLPDLDVRPQQQRRKAQVVPHRVAGEVGRVERVPAELAAKSGATEELWPRLAARCEHVAVRALQPPGPAVEDTANPWLRQRS